MQAPRSERHVLLPQSWSSSHLIACTYSGLCLARLDSGGGSGGQDGELGTCLALLPLDEVRVLLVHAGAPGAYLVGPKEQWAAEEFGL